MEEELNIIEKNETWSLVDRPKDKKVIGVNGFSRLSFIQMAQALSTNTKQDWLSRVIHSNIELILLTHLLQLQDMTQ